MSLLKGKVALVTGGTRGIGKAIVEKFVAEGANVAFTYHSSAKAAEALVTQLKTTENTVKAYASDAASFEATTELAKNVLADFGTIDVLVNNAGITQDNLLLRMKEEQWDAVINTNLKSVFNLTKQVMRTLLKKRSGSIINMSSVVGVKGNAGQANYAASKAGIIGFSKSIAQEVGSRNIRCNVIAPGFIATEMTESLAEDIQQNFIRNIPLKRFGTTEDVANAALFLASDLSKYVSGQVISVCGALNC